MRRVAEIRDRRPVFADTIGVLTSWSAGVLSITRRDGEAVRIPESVLVAGRAVPPAAPTRGPLAAPAASAAELREITTRCWPPCETERLGDWLLRAGGGFSRRANSVLAEGDPGLPFAETLARITGWYAGRSLAPRAQVAVDGALDEAFAAHGWRAEAPTLTRTAALPPLADAPGAGRSDRPVGLARRLDEGWLARYHRTGHLAPAARKVLGGGSSVWFATVADPDGSDRPAAIGRCAVEGRWAMFAAVEVAPAHRRRGLATAVMGALARAALAEGATGAFLQVEADNTAAGRLYDRLGFGTVGGHHYRRPAPDPAGAPHPATVGAAGPPVERRPGAPAAGAAPGGARDGTGGTCRTGPDGTRPGGATGGATGGWAPGT